MTPWNFGVNVGSSISTNEDIDNEGNSVCIEVGGMCDFSLLSILWFSLKITYF